MNLTAYSRNQLLNTFVHWQVPKEYADPLYNYLVHGFQPGSFWTAVLANDFSRAIQSSHPQNTIGALKAAVGWLNYTLEQGVAWGDYHTVNNWLKMTPDERRSVLESNRLVYTEQEEMVLVLRDEPTHEPILW